MFPVMFFAPLAAGLSIGLLAGWGLNLFLSVRGVRMISAGLAAAGWLLFFGGLLYWHFSVEPGLDGSEGSGVGFGFAMVHIGGIVVAIFATGTSATIALVSGIRPVSNQKER